MKIALVQSPLAWGELQENLQNFDKKMAECEAVSYTHLTLPTTERV